MEKSADNINTGNRDQEMAQSFNLNTFLQEYQTYTSKSYTAAENGKEAMEQREIAKAEEAVKSSGFLTLTLSEKLAELGVGERVLQQFADTAMDLLKDAINPLTDYLNKYENVFDEQMYNTEIQSFAKQMFFSRQALSQEAAENTTGQNFVMEM